MLKVRIAIMVLIWASALLAPAAAHDLTPSAEPAIAYYDYDGPDAGPATPGPTDPNGPFA
jgi:hypothetical protein